MAFDFTYHPINSATSEQVGFQGALARRQAAIQDQALQRQNAFRNILADSTDPNSGQIDYQNAFKKLNQAGLAPEALQLDQTVRKTENAQNLLGTITASLVRDPSDQNVTSAAQMFKSTTGMDHPGFVQLLNMPVESRRGLLIAVANSTATGKQALGEMFPGVERKTTDFNGGAQVETTTKIPMAGLFGANGQSGYPGAGSPSPQSSVSSPTSAGVDLHGDDFLKTLNPQISAQVKALAEGRMQFPAGFALKSPYWQNMISMVAKYDPSFDAVNYNARAATRKDFTSGKSADNITALNTAIAHLGALSDSYKALNNSDFPSYNAVSNYLGNQLGDKSVQGPAGRVSTEAEAVAHELAKVFRSTGMSEGEINAWKDKINTSAAPEQQKAIIDAAIELMNGRLEALNDRYTKGLGTTSQPLELLSPKSQQIIQRLQGGSRASSPSPGQASVNPRTGQAFRVGDLISGADGKTYMIKRLDPNGDHEVELVK